jgi:hypothetical protein
VVAGGDDGRLPVAVLRRYVVERLGEYEWTKAAYDALAGQKATITPELLRETEVLLGQSRTALLSLCRIAFELAVPHNNIRTYLKQIKSSDGRERWQLTERARAMIKNNAAHVRRGNESSRDALHWRAIALLPRLCSAGVSINGVGVSLLPLRDIDVFADRFE